MKNKNAFKFILPCSSSPGITIPELLVAIAIASILIVFAGQALIIQTRITSRSEATMRAQDTWSRIIGLIDQDIEEARCIKEPETSGTSLILSMSASCEDMLNDPTLSTVDVKYSFSDGALSRTGPPINPSDGSLDFSSDGLDIVSDLVTDFKVTRITNFSVNYELTLSDPIKDFTYPSRTATTHLRTRVID